MTGPPGPVIPEPAPSRRGASPASARRTVRPATVSGQRYGALPMSPDLSSSALAARVYAASHLTGTFTLRSGVTSTEYFDKYRFEADPVAAARPRGRDGAARARGHRRAGRPRARWGAARDDAVASDRPARPLRPQGGEDVRHLPARGRRRARRAPGSASSKTSSPRAARCSTPHVELRARGAVLDTVVCVIDRESGGVDQLRGGGPRAARAVHDERSSVLRDIDIARVEDRGEALALGRLEDVVGVQPLFAEAPVHRSHHTRGLRRTEPGIDEVAARRAAVVPGIRAPGAEPDRGAPRPAATAGRIFTARKIR